MFLTEPEEVVEQVRVIGPKDEEVINSSPVPVEHVTTAQPWAASLCFFLVDPVHLAKISSRVASWSAELVFDDACNVGDREA